MGLKKQAKKALVELIKEQWAATYYFSDSVGVFGLDVNTREDFKHEYVVVLMGEAWESKWQRAHNIDDDDTIGQMHEELEEKLNALERKVADRLLKNY